MPINVPDLITMGMSETEARIYFYLLENKKKNVDEMVKSLALSRARLLQVLTPMVERGFLAKKVINKSTYYFVDTIDKLNLLVEEKQNSTFVRKWSFVF